MNLLFCLLITLLPDSTQTPTRVAAKNQKWQYGLGYTYDQMSSSLNLSVYKRSSKNSQIALSLQYIIAYHRFLHFDENLYEQGDMRIHDYYYAALSPSDRLRIGFLVQHNIAALNSKKTSRLFAALETNFCRAYLRLHSYGSINNMFEKPYSYNYIGIYSGAKYSIVQLYPSVGYQYIRKNTAYWIKAGYGGVYGISDSYNIYTTPGDGLNWGFTVATGMNIALQNKKHLPIR